MVKGNIVVRRGVREMYSGGLNYIRELPGLLLISFTFQKAKIFHHKTAEAPFSKIVATV